MKIFDLRAALCVAVLMLATCSPKQETAVPPQADITASAEVVYYLVRHAEKVLNVDDPALTAQGQKRAADLAKRLRDVKLDKIYSTDTKRTRDTAGPTLEDQGKSLIIYDGRELIDFAAEMSNEKGHILIVGHSNTTPVLVGLLDGEPGLPIEEASEYDRLYIVSRTGKDTTTVMERYGN